MSKLIVNGGKTLEGVVRIEGAKNSVVALIAASLLCRGEVVLENVPHISDVNILISIINKLGVETRWDDEEENVLHIITSDDIETSARFDEVCNMRASNLLLGSLLGRKGKAQVALPGGCDLGARPMDLHIKGFVKLGAQVEVRDGCIRAVGRELVGNNVYLDFPSVGATENIMMAAALVKGHTILENVAKEPEIVDLANFLNGCGAKVRGAGTDIIRIEGVESLHGCRHTVIPDRIETGTFMAAAAVTGGTVKLENTIAVHLNPVIAKMREAGVTIRVGGNDIYVSAPERLTAVDIRTLAHPGFPTDMQPPFMSLLALAEGSSVVVETLFENRMKAAPELVKMGADISIDGSTAIIRGVDKLYGAKVTAKDLRAGAALIVAALAAEGQTEISGVSYIQRGYMNIDKKLRALGADITLVD